MPTRGKKAKINDDLHRRLAEEIRTDMRSNDADRTETPRHRHHDEVHRGFLRGQDRD
jgi:hypothetical protein